MKKRASPSKPLFDFLEIDAADVERHPTCIDDILAKRSTGIIIHDGLPARALQVAQRGIAEAAVPFHQRTFEGFAENSSSPFMLGQVLVAAAPDLEGYFATAGQTRRHLRELFAGELDIEERLVQLVRPLAANRPVSAPAGPQGQTYAPATIRSLPEGQGIGLHTDNASARTPQMQDLATRASVKNQLSFFFTLSAPEGGGQLIVYGLEWDDVARSFTGQTSPDEILYDQTNVMLPLVELSGSETFTTREGDLLIFDAGNYFHRVSPVRGVRSRMTLGGFFALSHDGTAVHYWS